MRLSHGHGHGCDHLFARCRRALLSADTRGTLPTRVALCRPSSSNALDFGEAFAKLAVRRRAAPAQPLEALVTDATALGATAEAALSAAPKSRMATTRAAQLRDSKCLLDIYRRLE